MMVLDLILKWTYSSAFHISSLQESSKSLWFGRDVFGRRSLLWHLPDNENDTLVLSSVHILPWVKLRLHYNELAQRTATVWRYLTFVDLRWYTLKKSAECDH